MSNESLYLTLSREICGFYLNPVFTEIQIKYPFFNFYFLNCNFSIKFSYSHFKLNRSFENTLIEGTLSYFLFYVKETGFFS